MNALHLSESDTLPGAPRAAYRLHRSLVAAGATSRMLVRRKLSQDDTVLRQYARFERERRQLDIRFDAAPLQKYANRIAATWSVNVRDNGIERNINRLAPDVVNLHWVGFGFVPIPALPKIAAPLVWTLRDMNSFSGGCHYDNGCGRYRDACGDCPQLGSHSESDLSRDVWQRKREAWSGLNLTLVGLSRWIVSLAQSSSLFRDTRAEVIPNGLDTTLFSPQDKPAARTHFGLPTDKKIVMFGAMKSTSDPRKGFHLLQAALQALARDGLADSTLAVVFGADAPSPPQELGLPAHYLGTLDERDVARAYAAADVFVAPSTEEVFGNTVLESLSCGVPCVAFRAGGVVDMIEHEACGYLAHPFEPADLARGIAWVIGDDARHAQLSRAARERCQSQFDSGVVARRYIALYEELVAATKSRHA